MELKRSVELSICALLKEKLADLSFYPSRGGTDDITPVWLASHNYLLGDILRATDKTKVHAIVVTQAGASGTTQPSWSDVVGSVYGSGSQPRYFTLQNLAVLKSADSGTPLPPLGVVYIEDAEKTMAQEETSYLQGHVVWVTRADSTTISAHSSAFKRIYDALCGIGAGYDIMRRITIHGIDVSKTDEFTDESRQAHGDVISFTLGVTEKFAQS